MIGKMNEDEAWRLIRDMASGLAFLHAMNPPILHQDIKPANILLSDNGDFQLTDFGVSARVKATMSRVSNQELALYSAGTISYMAPERFKRRNLPIKPNDIYSLGSTVYEMLSGDVPFGNDGGLLQMRGAEIPELPQGFSPLLNRTLEACLQENPDYRPTAAQLEEIANNALRDPNYRNYIPQELNRSQQTVINETQPYWNGNMDNRQSSQHAVNGNVSGYDSTVRNSNMGSGYGMTTQGSGMGSGYGMTMQGSGMGSGYGMSYADNPVTEKKKTSKAIIYSAIGAAAVVCILVTLFLSGVFSNKKPEPKPVAESFEVRFERAKFMMMSSENSAKATAGLDSLKQLSREGYSQATFLWSRIIFDNQAIQYGLDNPEWKRIKSVLKGYEPIDNMRAHELLELAVIQDREGQNWQALTELGYDYYKGRDRCKEYEKFLSEGRNEDLNKDENLRKAKEYFTKAAIHPEADASKTKVEILNIETQQKLYSNGRH
jgi:serine/threonine protein kinase